MLALNASSRFGPTPLPFVSALASVWQAPHLATNCCLPTIRFALSAPLTEQPEAATATARSAPARPARCARTRAASEPRGRGLLLVTPHHGAELYPNRRAVRPLAVPSIPRADASACAPVARRWLAAGIRTPTLSGKVPVMDVKQRYRLRNPSTGREIIAEVEPGIIYKDRDTGETLEVSGKMLPLAPSASNLPWSGGQPPRLSVVRPVAQKDLNECPTLRAAHGAPRSSRTEPREPAPREDTGRAGTTR